MRRIICCWESDDLKPGSRWRAPAEKECVYKCAPILPISVNLRNPVNHGSGSYRRTRQELFQTPIWCLTFLLKNDDAIVFQNPWTYGH